MLVACLVSVYFLSAGLRLSMRQFVASSSYHRRNDSPHFGMPIGAAKQTPVVDVSVALWCQSFQR